MANDCENCRLIKRISPLEYVGHGISCQKRAKQLTAEAEDADYKNPCTGGGGCLRRFKTAQGLGSHLMRLHNVSSAGSATESDEQREAQLSTIEALNREVADLKCEIKKLENVKEEKEKLEEEASNLRAAVIDVRAQLANEDLLVRNLFNTIQDMKGNIRVYCRVRPLSEKEISEGQVAKIKCLDDSVRYPWRGDIAEHTFDRVFDGCATQEDVFEVTKDMVQYAVYGHNVCIFSYGKTGSGNTHTMFGTEASPGLIPRAASKLFKIVEENGDAFLFSLKVYMLELYQDKLVDLLLPEEAQPSKLKIKQDSEGMVVVQNATVESISTVEALKNIIRKGLDQRHRARIQMNEESSSSHLIISIVVESTNCRTLALTRGKLSFVDLAGSGNIKDSGAIGVTLKEATKINLSLMALWKVIRHLSKEGSSVPDHVYRNDKLTMLMRDSLGGMAKTLMFVSISPTQSKLNETHTSLECAIGNDQRNVKEIRRLRKLVAYWKKKAREPDLEEIQEERPPR